MSVLLKSVVFFLIFSLGKRKSTVDDGRESRPNQENASWATCQQPWSVLGWRINPKASPLPDCYEAVSSWCVCLLIKVKLRIPLYVCKILIMSNNDNPPV